MTPKPAPDQSHFQELVKKACEAFERLSPEEKRAHRRAQAISFVYGQLMDCAPNVTKEEVAAIYDETH